MTFHYRFLLFTSVFETTKRSGKMESLFSKSFSCLLNREGNGHTAKVSMVLSLTFIFHLPLHPVPSLLYICGKDSPTRLKWKLSILTLQTWWKKKSICALWDTHTWGFPIKSDKLIETWITILTATLVFVYNKLKIKRSCLTEKNVWPFKKKKKDKAYLFFMKYGAH